jgi:hypothetical protein
MINAITPKAQFLADSKRADAHIEVVMSPAFKIAVEAALLEYIFRQTDHPATVQDLGYVGVKIRGAREFIGVLLNLGEQGQLAAPNKNYELDP